MLQTPDPPPLPYIKGRLNLLNRAAITIMGSRNATAQCKSSAEAFASALYGAGLTVVSGLAGKASTVAIVGTGLGKVYPARNREVAHEIALKGTIVSEFALATPPLAANFPSRNCVIAGISRGTLVV